MKLELKAQEQTTDCWRVLIVDDDKDFTRSLRLLLDRHARDNPQSPHYALETAHSASAALELIQTFPAQVAVLDIRLGFDSGINLISQFKQINPDILCIMLTAFATLDTSIKAFQEGAYDYLRKPLHPNELFSALDRCFERITLENGKRQADAALRNSEARLRAVLDNTINGLITINEQGIIESFNKRAEQIFGHNSADVIGKNVKLLMPEPYRNQHDGFIQNHLRAGKSRIIGTSFETTGCHRDKRELPIELTISEIHLEQQRILLGIVRDLTEHKQWEDHLKVSREHLRALSNRLQTIREEERTRIARNVHDEIGQDLVALQMDLSMLETSLGSGDDSIRERFKVMRTLILNTLQKAENIATELRPAVLDVLGLTKAMEWHMNDFKARTGINYCFQDISEASLPDKERSTALFRIFQEAIANIGRHAQASQIHITLNSAPESIALAITDNGKGISLQQVHDIKSLGILGMQERARMMGGSCEIHRNDEGGTCVTITLPNSKNDR